jgi:hypothetical protein
VRPEIAWADLDPASGIVKALHLLKRTTVRRGRQESGLPRIITLPCGAPSQSMGPLMEVTAKDGIRRLSRGIAAVLRFTA